MLYIMGDKKISGVKVIVREMYFNILVGHIMCNKKESRFVVIIREIYSGI